MNRSLERLPLRALPAPTSAARALLREVSSAVSGHASLASQERIAYARDQWAKGVIWARAGFVPRPPDLVAWPSNLDEVVALTRLASRLSVPLIPYGGGSGLCGGALASRGGIVVDMKRMDRLVALDADAPEVDVEAGIVGARLERELAAGGLTTGHLPGSLGCSTVGGWLATRSAGQGSGRYGKIEDLVASVTVVDGRGEVHVTPRRPLPGADLTGLFLGSEGALGTICSARLHLVRRPASRAFASFAFRGLQPGLEALRAIVRAGVRPAIARLYDPLDTLLAAKAPTRPARRRGLLRDQLGEKFILPAERILTHAAAGRPLGLNLAAGLLRECMLLLVFEGEAELPELEAEEASRLCAAGGGEDLGPEPAQLWLENRFASPFRQSRLFDAGAFVDTLEVAATWERAFETWERVREAVAPLAFVYAHFAHARVEGCALGFTFVGPAGDLEQTERRYDELWRAALAAVRAAGAAFSHHQGVGLARLNAFKGELGDGARLMRGLKATFDPQGIMNPGKLGA